MKNKQALLTAAILIILATTAITNAKYSGGTGDPNDPYRIATPADLNDIRNHPEDYNDCFILVNDINMVDYTYDKAVIAWHDGTSSSFSGTVFTGSFDGNGKVISNLTITINFSVSYDYFKGLFGYTDGGTITNLGLEGGSFAGFGDYVGGLVGYARDGHITNSYATGEINGSSSVGGLVGFSYRGNTANCYSIGAVSGSSYVGGLVGNNLYSGITNSYATGIVSGSSYVGGLIGYTDNGSINNCYASGEVNGSSSVGGLVGFSYRGSTANCYSIGAVSGSSYVGGLIGLVLSPSLSVIINNFWDFETSGTNLAYVEHIFTPHGTNIYTNIYSTPGVAEGKITLEMQGIDTFLGSSWDFVEVWDICEGTNYPKLRWSVPAGDLVCPDGVDFVDYSYLANVWGVADPDCDLDLSGVVDANDLLLLSDDWLEGF